MEGAKSREHKVGDTVFRVDLMYTDALGNEWYTFADPLRMPAQRALAAEVAATWADLNIAKEDLADYVRRMKAYGNEGDIVRLFHLLTIIEQRLEWACEDKTLLALAKCYYLINDEPIMSPSDQHNRLKDEVWDRDRECRGFFLRSAFVLTKGYSQFSPNDILSYLEVQKVEEAKGGLRSVRVTASGQSTKPSSPESTTSTSRLGSLPVKPRPRRKR